MKLAFLTLALLLAQLNTNLYASGNTLQADMEAMHPYFDQKSVISGEITLSKDLQKKLSSQKKLKFTSEDVLYVIARKESKNDKKGDIKGVIRVDKLKEASFPIHYTIGSHNIMMGDPKAFTGKVVLFAKLSRQGGAISKAGDLVNPIGINSQIGEKNVSLELSTVIKNSAAPVDVTAPTKSPAQVSSMPTISGTIMLSSKMQAMLKGKVKLAANSRLFIVAKNSGSTRPMPVAVVAISDLTTKNFPLAFTMTASNMLAGGDFSGPYELSAKLTISGDASSSSKVFSGKYKKNKMIRPSTSDLNIELNEYR